MEAQPINWTTVLVALLVNLPLILGGFGTLIVCIRNARNSVNNKVGDVQQAVDQNTHITKYIPDRIEHKLKNGAGDIIAEKTAERVQANESAQLSKAREDARNELMDELRRAGRLKE